jgi:hypothetical protein
MAVDAANASRIGHPTPGLCCVGAGISASGLVILIGIVQMIQRRAHGPSHVHCGDTPQEGIYIIIIIVWLLLLQPGACARGSDVPDCLLRQRVIIRNWKARAHLLTVDAVPSNVGYYAVWCSASPGRVRRKSASVDGGRKRAYNRRRERDSARLGIARTGSTATPHLHTE